MQDYAARMTSGPAVEPITLAEAKRHANVVADDEDALLSALIAAARELVEQDTSRALITQTWVLRLHEFFADQVELPRAPLQSVTHIKYLDQAGVEQTLPATYYDVDTTREPGVVWRDEDVTWPTISDEANAVTITYVAGYGATASAVPGRAKQAILLLVGHWYRCREAVAIGTINSEIELTYRRLIRSLCLGSYP